MFRLCRIKLPDATVQVTAKIVDGTSEVEPFDLVPTAVVVEVEIMERLLQADIVRTSCLGC